MPKRKQLLAVILLLVGISQMTADVFGLPAFKAVAAATGASPAPKVFSAVQSYEAFSADYFIEWQGKHHKTHRMQLTPEISKNLLGPYNRRNVYGAVISFAPLLRSHPQMAVLMRNVFRHASCKQGILDELGIDRNQILGPVRYQILPKSVTNPKLQFTYEEHCEL